MTRQHGHPATYDRMMAELQLDSDEDERETKYSDPRKYDARESRRRSTMQSPKSEEKRKDDQRYETTTPEVEEKNSESRRRPLSFPKDKIPSRHGSSSFSRSNTSEDEVPNDSDGSDQEREAPVVNANRELFGAANAAINDRECGPTGRTEVDALRSFVMRSPAQGSAAIRCYVERDRQGLNRLHPVFRLFLESEKQFLLCAQKRTSSKTSNYLLTMEQNPTNRRSNLIVGKLRGNWSGSEYTVYDDGMSPSKTALEANVRNILGAVEFSYDEMGPGRLSVQIPQVQPSGAASPWKDKLESGSGESERLFVLHNKRPHFDEKTGGHVLDFGGRVTMPSIKNFQMMCDALGDDTVLQFGRVSCQPPGPRTQCKCHKSIFIMDVKYPLSPLQGFAICLATLDTKFTDLKLYDNVSKLMKRK
ncbi:Tubby-related protein 1 [Phytophthora ramorum]|uniref:Tubby-related protein 1 n=1 Tax=Phytophthora ramorum TaxID=164328 RepID=UPI0030A4A41C|nr:Tubby-related protein 1 [Phytophthora ramorum]